MSTRIAYFDCTAGISGDMVLGALVDAGLPFDRLEESLSRLSISEFSIRHEKVQKAGIAATRVTVDAKEGHVHRGLSDVLSILDGSDLTETVTAWSRAIFERLDAPAHGGWVGAQRLGGAEQRALPVGLEEIVEVIPSQLAGHELHYAAKSQIGSPNSQNDAHVCSAQDGLRRQHE